MNWKGRGRKQLWINRANLKKGLRKFMVNSWIACAWSRFKPATHFSTKRRLQFAATPSCSVNAELLHKR